MSLEVIKQQYHVEKYISEELFSHIALGRHVQSGKELRIWRIKAEFLNANIVKDILEKADRIMELDHPNLLPLIDADYNGDTIDLIYECAHTVMTLENYIKQHKAVSDKTFWTWIKSIISGLKRVEEVGLFHGRINLNTLLVSEDADVLISMTYVYAPLLNEFLSRVDVIEDVLFLAPEILQNDKVTSQSDIYSLGVLMYVFFSSSWPYPYTASITELKKAILKGPISFKAKSDIVPTKVAALIVKSIQVSPTQRFQTLDDLVTLYKGGQIQVDDVEETGSEIQKKFKEEVKQTRVSYIKKIGSLMIVFVGLILLWLGMNTFYMNYFSEIPDQIVPDVVGMPLDDAIQTLSESDFKSQVVGRRIHEFYPKDTIIETKPPGGRQVKQNRKIRLFVSDGVAEIVLPEIEGRNIESARSILHNLGLDLTVTRNMHSFDIPKDHIITQFPSENVSVSPSQNVEVIVSLGFPIEISARQTSQWFFSSSDMFDVEIELDVLEEWPTQHVVIQLIDNQIPRVIFDDMIYPGQQKILHYDISKHTIIEILYNDKLATRQEIKTDISRQENVNE